MVRDSEGGHAGSPMAGDRSGAGQWTVDTNTFEFDIRDRLLVMSARLNKDGDSVV